MSGDMVTVLELKAWGLDANPYRPAHLEALATVVPVVARPALEDDTLTDQARPYLDRVATRPDLQEEFRGLCWRLGVVNLRALLAFQRRLVLSDPDATDRTEAQDWNSLAALSFGPPRSIAHQRINAETIVSSNPDLVLRPSPDGLTLYGGSPFFEVATYAGRAFLRDGYHRAYALLCAGIDAVPAVIVTAHSLGEVGATGPNFFAEAALFDARPPLVADFLSSNLTHRYTRPRLHKTIRVTIHESFAPND